MLLRLVVYPETFLGTTFFPFVSDFPFTHLFFFHFDLRTTEEPGAYACDLFLILVFDIPLSSGFFFFTAFDSSYGVLPRRPFFGPSFPCFFYFAPFL